MASGKKVVLVVEDHASVGGLIAGLVRQEGYRTIRAWDMREAARTARGRMPDLFILDLNLAYPDGIPILQHLVAQSALKQSPVIVVTGGTVKPSTADAPYIREIVSKPFHIDVLLNAVRAALGEPTVEIVTRQSETQDYFLNGY